MKLLLNLVVTALYLTMTPVSWAGDAALNKELAEARAATAKYHDVANAIADGYVEFGANESGEGIHYANFSLIDGVFDINHPELLLYKVLPNGKLQLAAVEYVVPLSLSATAPEGFTGSEDLWRANTEGFGLWEMTAWIWLNNPDGMFTQLNPRIP